MDFLKFLNNGYDPALILGHGALGFRPYRIIEGTGRHTQIHGNYSQTQVMSIPPQDLKIDVVERDKKGKVKKILQTLDLNSTSQKVSDILGNKDNDNDDIINLITLSGHIMTKEFEEQREEDERRQKEYRKLIKKNPKLKELYEMEHKPKEPEPPKGETDVEFYKRRIIEIEKEIEKEETEHLLINPTGINRSVEALREQLKEYNEKLKEAEGKVKTKYKPGKRGNVKLNTESIQHIEDFNFTQLKKKFIKEYAGVIDFINSNDEVVDLDELATLNESYFPPAYIDNTIANTELWKEKSKAIYGKDVSLKAGGILEKNLTVNEDEDMPEEVRIKRNLAEIITGINSDFKDMDTNLKNNGYSGETSTFYDAYNKQAKVLAEIKKYTTYGNKKEEVEAFMTHEHSYNSLLEVRRENMNNYWNFLRQQIMKLWNIYLTGKNSQAIIRISELLDSITNDEYDFSIEKFELLYRKNNNYVGIPIGINKFPIPSPSNWNESISPNTLDDVKHIREKRKTNYEFKITKTYKIKRVIDHNKTSGDSNTETLDEVLFDDDEKYDVVFIVLLDDSLLFFNLSDYLRKTKDEPINLFELTDSYYTDTKKGEYDSLNIPIELFTPIDLMDRDENDEPFFYGGEKFKKVKQGKTFTSVPNKTKQYDSYVNNVKKEIKEYTEEQEKIKKKKVNKSTKGKIINI